MYKWKLTVRSTASALTDKFMVTLVEIFLYKWKSTVRSTASALTDKFMVTPVEIYCRR